MNKIEILPSDISITNNLTDVLSLLGNHGEGNISYVLQIGAQHSRFKRPGLILSLKSLPGLKNHG